MELGKEEGVHMNQSGLGSYYGIGLQVFKMEFGMFMGKGLWFARSRAKLYWRGSIG